MYQQYLVSVAFERPDASLLRQAKSWIARGKKEAADINGDGYTCIRILENSPTKIVFSDNVLPL